MSRTKAMLPARRWLAATLVVVLLSGTGALVVHRQISSINQNHFDVAVNAVETNIDDRVSAFNLISAAVLLAMSPDGGGITLEDFSTFLEQRSGTTLATLGSIGPLIVSFPWDGLSAIAFVTAEPDGSTTLFMAPNFGGIGTDTLALPEIDEAIGVVSATDRPAMSRPFASGGHDFPLLAYVVPLSDNQVVVTYANPAALIEDAIRGTGANLLHADVSDAHTGIELLTTGTSEHANVNQHLNVFMLGSEWSVALTPGPDFSWLNSTVPWLTTLAMGIFFSGLVFMAGLHIRRRAQEEKARQDTSRRIHRDKDRFIAAVSHELRTPLTTLVGLSAAMASRPDGFLPEEIAEFGDSMSQQSKEMAMLVEDLLIVARSDHGTVAVVPKEIDIPAEIGRTIDGLGDLAASITLMDCQATAWADPLRARQIVRNLLTNAIRHGGPSISARAFQEAEAVHIEVSDDGPPISDEARLHMFDPYYHAPVTSGPAPSVGLGLSVARQLAGLMGGRLEYRREANRSVFRLTLPVAPAAPAAAELMAEPVALPASPATREGAVTRIA